MSKQKRIKGKSKSRYRSFNRESNRKIKRNVRVEQFNIGIDMKEAHDYTLKKQTGIAEAARKGNDTLRDIIANELIDSDYAKAVAIQNIVTNKGYRSPGLSKHPFCTNEDYKEMIITLGNILKNPERYKATALDRIYIDKPDGGKRPISIPSYTDRCLQALYKLALEPYAEEIADINSYGFRPIRSPIWAIGRLFNLFQFIKYRFAVSVDITKCYDKIDHDYILLITPIINKHILKQWLKCGFVDHTRQENPTETGVPQGGIISPLLANLTLDGIELYVKRNIRNNRKDYACEVIRFADDIVVLTKSLQNCKIALTSIREFLNPKGLEINDNKTNICDIYYDHFKFLGFQFQTVISKNRDRRTIYISIPLEASRRLKKKIREITKKNRRFSLAIKEANPILRGWANYYRHAHNSQRVYNHLQWWLWVHFLRYGKRLLKYKYDKMKIEELTKLTIDTYFRPFESKEQWPTGSIEGKPIQLFNLESIKFKAAFYQITGRNAFIESDRASLDTTSLRNKTSTWKSTVISKWNNCCGLCGKHLELNYTPIEFHHIKPRLYGGKDLPNNIVPLCKSPCHLMVTNAVKSRTIEKIEHFESIGILDLSGLYKYDEA